MKTMSVTLLILVMLVSVVVPSAAQMDLAKVLVGKWEGEFRKVHPKQTESTARTLILGQVRDQDGKWSVGEARYGITGKPLSRVDVTLEVRGDEVTVKFDTGDRSAVILHLSKEGSLVGTIHLTTLGTSAMELKKVE